MGHRKRIKHGYRRFPYVSDKDLSVVSFVMPINQNTRKDNAAAEGWPAERWAQTRLLGEIFSQAVVREIVTDLMDKGILAISPDVTPKFNKKRYPNVGWASPWSRILHMLPGSAPLACTIS